MAKINIFGERLTRKETNNSNYVPVLLKLSNRRTPPVAFHDHNEAITKSQALLQESYRENPHSSAHFHRLAKGVLRGVKESAFPIKPPQPVPRFSTFEKK